MPIWILLLCSALAQDSPVSRDANLPAARAYIAQGNFAKAAESLDLVLAANPDAGSEPYLTLIDCRLKLDQKEKALEAAERGIKRYPVSGPLLKAAGAIILQENPFAEKKLLIIDESESSGKLQYQLLKKFSGQKYLEVKKKYLQQY